jgi:hypothetical protein
MADHEKSCDAIIGVEAALEILNQVRAIVTAWVHERNCQRIRYYPPSGP